MSFQLWMRGIRISGGCMFINAVFVDGTTET